MKSTIFPIASMVHDATKNGVAGGWRAGERAHAHPKVGAGERRSCKSVVGGDAGAAREGQRGCAPSGHKFPSKSRSKRQLPARPRVKWRKASEKRKERSESPVPSTPTYRFDPRSLISRLTTPPSTDPPVSSSRANVTFYFSFCFPFFLSSDPITGDYVEMI